MPECLGDFWPFASGRSDVRTVRPRIRVRNLEAVDGTPILDVKPVLRPTTG